MCVADMPAFIDQVKCGPVAILVSSPGKTVIVLRYCIGNVHLNDGRFQILKIFFMAEFRIMVADDNQPVVFVSVVPFPQRGNYPLAVYSTKGPHFQQYDLSTQLCQTQRSGTVEPGFIVQLRGWPEVSKDSCSWWRWRSRRGVIGARHFGQRCCGSRGCYWGWFRCCAAAEDQGYHDNKERVR
jgi:hypothetical protein